MEIVNELKSGKLCSWNQTLELAYKEEEFDEVRKMLNQRPGIYFRQVNRLLNVANSTPNLSGKIIADEENYVSLIDHNFFM